MYSKIFLKTLQICIMFCDEAFWVHQQSQSPLWLTQKKKYYFAFFSWTSVTLLTHQYLSGFLLCWLAKVWQLKALQAARRSQTTGGREGWDLVRIKFAAKLMNAAHKSSGYLTSRKRRQDLLFNIDDFMLKKLSWLDRITKVPKQIFFKSDVMFNSLWVIEIY